MRPPRARAFRADPNHADSFDTLSPSESRVDTSCPLDYWLAVFPIQVPPLRTRREDILPPAEHFLVLHGRSEQKQSCQLSSEAAHLLLTYDWPGG
ncbi:MAG TPA: hypothetical protein QF557_02630 [Myxococcota bacterium]|jgi:transcriptional regulator with AAA-type ATPase domain|nr:hypothetical protein [Myxococcota bacterium]